VLLHIFFQKYFLIKLFIRDYLKSDVIFRHIGEKQSAEGVFPQNILTFAFRIKEKKCQRQRKKTYHSMLNE